MTIPASLARAARNAVATNALISDPAALRAHNRPQMRRYDVMALAPNGDIIETRHVAPALPMFEGAFCAFTRGSLIETDCGPVAIEDLLPGDRILTDDGEARPVLWKGRVTLVPGRPDAKGRVHKLTRINPDSFGLQRPMSCLIAGPTARIFRQSEKFRKSYGRRSVLAPLQEFIDGINVTETAPPTSVELFHLCLDRHSLIRIGGMQFETYHPGSDAPRTFGHALRSLYLSLFPHVSQLADFGPQLFPRLDDPRPQPISA
ncbi:Hint domain-containing protein [Jhaorihella thermophila]|uniref:Hint domain-containing protein n=1 Tax=Jhaorihella thermophila TaxID=488547 RepID=A0A1H5W388_9RHOB|nr:Hint domain-containing protein [Jhaorihella thermophila]SEF93962.1 Hint domain-containing protein [Jhaorihella thermophila]